MCCFSIDLAILLSFNLDSCDLLVCFIECVEQMVLNMRMKDEISPALRTIVNQFDENNRRPSDFQFSGQNAAEEFGAADDCEIGIDGEDYGNCTSWSDDHDDQTVADVGSNDADSNFPTYPQVFSCVIFIESSMPIFNDL